VVVLIKIYDLESEVKMTLKNGKDDMSNVNFGVRWHVYID